MGNDTREYTDHSTPAPDATGVCSRCGHPENRHTSGVSAACSLCSCMGFIQYTSEYAQRRRHILGAREQHALPTDVNARQVGGSHYGLRSYQHWDVVAEFNLDYFQGQITKYVMRWRDKNGVEDLEKAAHYLEKYIAIERAKQEEPKVLHFDTPPKPRGEAIVFGTRPDFPLPLMYGDVPPSGVRYVRFCDINQSTPRPEAPVVDLYVMSVSALRATFGSPEGERIFAEGERFHSAVGNDDAIDGSHQTPLVEDAMAWPRPLGAR